MIKEKLYRYLGRNGIITSPIQLEQINPIQMYFLKASEGKLLTNGSKTVFTITVFEEELNEWYEIDDPNWEGEK